MNDLPSIEEVQANYPMWYTTSDGKMGLVEDPKVTDDMLRPVPLDDYEDAKGPWVCVRSDLGGVNGWTVGELIDLNDEWIVVYVKDSDHAHHICRDRVVKFVDTEPGRWAMPDSETESDLQLSGFPRRPK